MKQHLLPKAVENLAPRMQVAVIMRAFGKTWVEIAESFKLKDAWTARYEFSIMGADKFTGAVRNLIETRKQDVAVAAINKI